MLLTVFVLHDWIFNAVQRQLYDASLNQYTSTLTTGIENTRQFVSYRQVSEQTTTTSETTTTTAKTVSINEPCHYLTMSRSRDSKDGRWYNFTLPDFKFYAYSTFYYSAETSPPTKSVVKIIALSSLFEKIGPGVPNVIMKSSRSLSPKLVCILYYRNITTVTIMTEKPVAIGFGNSLFGEFVGEYVYTCDLTAKLIGPPMAVAVSTVGELDLSVDERHHQSCMPVESPMSPKFKRDFCVCVSVAFGNLNSFRLIEWLEMMKLQGVSKIVSYDIGVDAEAVRILEQYEREGFVDFRKTNHFNPDEPLHHVLQSSSSINDCMYRNMNEFNYVVVIDFDEVIVPQNPKHTRLRDLINDLNEAFDNPKNNRPCSYVFRNNYFFLDFAPDVNQSNLSTFLRYRNRVDVSPIEKHPKSIINPLACSHAHNHYCWGLNPPYLNDLQWSEVDPEVALSQHYKKCHLSAEECEVMMRNVSRLDSMLKYKDKLLSSMAKQLQILF